jgi:hypothetical protein
MDKATARTLRMLARTRTKAELAALFAAIRAESDKALLAAAAPPKKAPRRKDFAAGVAERLAPILGPATEKAEMLIDALAATHGEIDIPAVGLLPTIRKLAARYGEDAVAAAADALMARLKAWGSTRERVK